MRTSWIVIAAAIVGCGIGLGLTWLEVVRYGDHFEASFVDHAPETNPMVIPPVATVIGESVFDFGTLEQNQTGKCTFKVKNTSGGDLMVDLEGVSCGLCIKTDLTQTPVPPGDEFEFAVNYTTHKEGPEFSEYVEMRTSDPDKPVIRFSITGYVSRLIRFSREAIALGSVSAGESSSAEFRIFGFKDAPIEIIGHEFIPETPVSYFKLEFSPLKLEDFKDEAPRAKSAVQAKLTMAPGRPLGPINLALGVTAKMGDATASAELPVSATIVSDIVLIGGRDFDKIKNLVSFRSIKSEVGASTTLRIRVRGPAREKIKLSVGKIDPEGVLTAELGEPSQVGNGFLYPLTVTVTKGAASVNRLGSQQGKVGVINIETTHATAKTLPVYVSFAIE